MPDKAAVDLFKKQVAAGASTVASGVDTFFNLLLGAYDDTEILKKQGYTVKFERLVGSTPPVEFKAFMTDFSDEYTTEWTPEEIFGRMDPIVTFKGTARKISVGWDVVSFGAAEAAENLANLSTLMKMLYPEFDANGAIKTPPLFKIKFTNMIQNQTNMGSIIGAVEGFSYSPDLDSGFFSIGSGKNGKLLAQTVSMNCTIIVLHTHDLGWNEHGGAERGGFEGFPYALPKSSGKVSTGGSGGSAATDTGVEARRNEQAARNVIGPALVAAGR